MKSEHHLETILDACVMARDNMAFGGDDRLIEFSDLMIVSLVDRLGLKDEYEIKENQSPVIQSPFVLHEVKL